MRFKKELENKIVVMHDKGLSATAIGKELGKFTSSILRVIRRNGREPNFEYGGKGSNHSQWKGGRGIKSGYWTVYNPEHPRSMNTRRVYEHIIIAEKKMGRRITKKEPIHHINFDRLDNSPSNLYVCKDNKEHMDLHYSLEEVARELFRGGKLKFKDGKYIWKD